MAPSSGSFSCLFHHYHAGVYESFDNISTYLECDPCAVSDPDKNFWVSYRMGVMNQKDSTKSLWKESSLCTKNWSSSILQFMKMEDFLEPGAGYLVRETVTFVCEILDYCPWFEFSDLEVCMLCIYCAYGKVSFYFFLVVQNLEVVGFLSVEFFVHL